MESGQTVNREEKYIKDGRELFVNVIKIPLRDEKGNIAGIIRTLDRRRKKHTEIYGTRLLQALHGAGNYAIRKRMASCIGKMDILDEPP